MAGDPETSFLMRKLEGPGLGEGAAMPSDEEELAAAYLDYVRAWIDQGARP